jgi:hypothetical protein
MSLVIALQQADRLEQMLIESGGEITEEISAELSVNPKTIGELVDIRYVSLERMAMSQEFFKTKAEQFAKIAKSLDSAQEFLLANLKEYMILNDKKELKGDEYQFKLSNMAPKVSIADEAKVPAAYKTQKVVESIDKKKIAEDLKLGVPVEGCVLQEVYSLRKSINKGK